MRVLIVNPFGIGDVLFSTPIIRTVREAYAGSFIGYLCNRRTQAILETNPHLNELFVYEKDEFVGLWRTAHRQGMRYVLHLLNRIRRARFDVAIDLSLGERYGFLLRLMGVPRVVGYDFRKRGRFLTERLPIIGYHHRHVVECYRELLEYLGFRLLAAALELRTGSEDRVWVDTWLGQRQLNASPRLIGIVPAGGVSWGISAPFRRWHAAGFAAVADALVKRFGAQVLLFGEPADREACDAVAAAMHHPAVNVSGQTNLGQFVSFLARLDLVICNDGGPLHLAVSQGVPTVSIFGPVDPTVYGPYPPGDSRHRVVCQAAVPCRPCYHQFRLPPCPYERSCLTTITPGEVLEACIGILEQHGAPRPRPLVG